MTVYLLRHARAGERSAWKGDDRLRPLSKVGKRQATGIADLLADARIEQICASPYVRCRQSVEPLAARLGVEIDDIDDLAEGMPVDGTLRLIEKVAHRHAVLCTHGDIVEEVLAQLRTQGVKLGKAKFEKGSIWALETQSGAVVRATYIAPPK